MAEPIDILFGVETPVGPRNVYMGVLNGGIWVECGLSHIGCLLLNISACVGSSNIEKNRLFVFPVVRCFLLHTDEACACCYLTM